MNANRCRSTTLGDTAPDRPSRFIVRIHVVGGGRLHG